MRNEDLYYYDGEKPPPLTIRYEDKNGNLIATIAGATFSAKTQIDEESEVAVACTDLGDGTLTIDWPTDTSVFIVPTPRERSNMRVDIEVTQGPTIWFLPRFTIPVIKRV